MFQVCPQEPNEISSIIPSQKKIKASVITVASLGVTLIDRQSGNTGDRG
jgi:hypothetical protein